MRTAMRAAMFPGLLAVASRARGGGGKHGDTTPAGNGGGGGASEAGGGERAEPAGNEMVAPEKIDEVNRLLDRKATIMSRCLSIAIDNKELPKNSRGKITLEIVIAPAGKAESVKIVRSTLESRTLGDCVIGHVREIQFPELPRPYETSHTYGFEAM
jgi:hypothetical protein